jgi:hypothetical protein
MSVSGFPDFLIIRLPENGFSPMQVVVGIIVAFGAQLGEGFVCLRMFLQYSIGFAILKDCEDLVPPKKGSGNVDFQGFGYSPEGNIHVHESNVLHPDFLGEMAPDPYRSFLFSKSLVAVNTHESLITCRGLPILAHMGTSTMWATWLLFLGFLVRFWCSRLGNLAKNELLLFF